MRRMHPLQEAVRSRAAFFASGNRVGMRLAAAVL